MVFLCFPFEGGGDIGSSPFPDGSYGWWTYRYRVRNPERDKDLRARLKELAARRMRFGYRRLTVMLAREGIPANHKRVYRLYREEGLAMRIRQRRRIQWNGQVVRPAAERANQRWSIDFVSDSD